MAKMKAKKRNPQDVTLRNVRAGLKRDRALDARLCALEKQVGHLTRAFDLGWMPKKPKK